MDMCVYVRIRSRTLIIAFKILQCQMSIIILTMLPSTYFAKATRFFLLLVRHTTNALSPALVFAALCLEHSFPRRPLSLINNYHFKKKNDHNLAVPSAFSPINAGKLLNINLWVFPSPRFPLHFAVS